MLSRYGAVVLISSSRQLLLHAPYYWLDCSLDIAAKETQAAES
jgi:hypothetical protein